MKLHEPLTQSRKTVCFICFNRATDQKKNEALHIISTQEVVETKAEVKHLYRIIFYLQHYYIII